MDVITRRNSFLILCEITSEKIIKAESNKIKLNNVTVMNCASAALSIFRFFLSMKTVK
jgi:hypothetical protein